ncbi:MAG TPA: phosphohistidine phosphatase SixA [Bryobacteraceae bacterium]|nr:phosphohistidine phosphatase SixA [Bryobacteraceae bacterium]
MHVYLLRHGIAEEERLDISDSERALTPDGRRKLRQVLKTVAEAGVKPTLILSSPFKRAVQTAQIAKDLLGYESQVLQTKTLTPGSHPEQVWEEIRVHRNELGVLLVGHNPLFDNLAVYLLGAPHLSVDFKKGAIMRIDVEGFGAHPRGVLCWYLTAKLSASRE